MTEFQIDLTIERAKNPSSKSKELVVSTLDAWTKLVWESKELMVGPFENSGSSRLG